MLGGNAGSEEQITSGQPTEVRVLLDPAFGWTSKISGNTTVHGVGDPGELGILCEAIKGNPSDIVSICHLARSRHGHFGLIVETPGKIFAVADRIRGYPLHYGRSASGAYVSNSARLLALRAQFRTPDSAALREFTMAGYTLGRSTVWQGLYQLQAGELLVWDSHRPASSPACHRYAPYRPNPRRQGSDDDYLAQLSAVIDRVFRRVVEKANGAPIWLPLSGGYDSRLIACKLRELNYPNLRAFTYGPPNNSEAKIAWEVAQRLEIPWMFVPSKAAGARQLFESDRRRAYWRYADGLSTIPSMREWQALSYLTSTDEGLGSDAVIINGQSGDFLSGGHIPPLLWNKQIPEARDFFEALIAKHFALWTNFHKQPHLDAIRESISRALEGWVPRDGAKEELIARYEELEFQERQSKFVINGQRMYEFFGLPKWQLPHWDGELIDFWQGVPFELKFGQNLYKTYLCNMDFRGLFRNYDPFAWRWPTHMMWVVPFARIAGVLFGEKAKLQTYRQFWYFSHYHNHYAMYGYRNFRRTFSSARSPISLQVERWLQENEFLVGNLNDGQLPAVGDC